MPSAQRRKRLAKFSFQKKRCLIGFRKIVLIVLLVLCFFIFTFLSAKYFRQDAKLGLVINGKDGNLLIVIIDPIQEEITNIIVPANTQMSCSRQLGIYKAKSIWQLGINNNLSGLLLKETIIKTFHFPVVAWADSPAEGFSSGKFFPLLTSVFSFYKTNLGVGDRLKIAIFSLGVKNYKRIDINLENTQVLKKTRLIDGEEGYIPVEDIPEKVSMFFSDSQASQKGFKMVIKDATGKNLIAEELGKTIEVLGAKIGFISKDSPKNFDCLVSGKDNRFLNRIAQIFSCEKTVKKDNTNFDFELEIGEKFAKRF